MPSLEIVEISAQEGSDPSAVTHEAGTVSTKRKVTPNSDHHNISKSEKKKRLCGQLTLADFFSKPCPAETPSLDQAQKKGSQRNVSSLAPRGLSRNVLGKEKKEELMDIVLGRHVRGITPKQTTNDSPSREVRVNLSSNLQEAGKQCGIEAMLTKGLESVLTSSECREDNKEEKLVEKDKELEVSTRNTQQAKPTPTESKMDLVQELHQEPPLDAPNADSTKEPESISVNEVDLISKVERVDIDHEKDYQVASKSTLKGIQLFERPESPLRTLNVPNAMEKPAAPDTIASSDDVKKERDEAMDVRADEKEPSEADVEDPSAEEEFKNTRRRSKRPKRAAGLSSQESVISNELKHVFPLSEDAQALIEKHSSLRQTYLARAKELLERCRQGVKEDIVEIPVPKSASIPESHVDEGIFPDFAVQHLTAMVEGSSLPLKTLASQTSDRLNKLYSSTICSAESTAVKIKLIATRKDYVKNPGAIENVEKSESVDIFEDANVDHMWRWEVTLIDLLPGEYVSKAKKSRAARKKLSSHYNSLAKFLTTLNDADKLIRTEEDLSKLSKVLAKVSQEEEKVLRFERDEEKVRLAAEAKERKVADKIEQQKRKAKAEERKLEEKQKMALEKQREKERRKQEVAEEKRRQKEAREELKRMEVENKKIEEQKRLTKEKDALMKQKTCMQSFFGAKVTKTLEDIAEESDKTPPVSEPKATTGLQNGTPLAFDIQEFRRVIQSSTKGDLKTREPAKGTISGRKVRRLRTRNVKVSVFLTRLQDDPFASEPYVERQFIEVPNKYKFFLFHEDVRPPYHGTWSKKSQIVTGRSPFKKDSTCLDYEYDSEAEWEEGDDEIGEDIENENGDEDEEEKDEDEGEMEEDGWLAADDEVDGDLDEETKLLREKQFELKREADRGLKELKVCVVSPETGCPLNFDSNAVEEKIDGFEKEEAFRLVNQHNAFLIAEQFDLFLDPFPPSLVDEVEVINSQSSPDPNCGSKALSTDDMRTFAKFVHRNTLSSKEKLIDDLRQRHSEISSSRAQALRHLESIATKKKHPTFGTYWEVSKDHLTSLCLDDLATAPFAETEAQTSDALKTLASFVHRSTINSKDKLVDEFRKTHGEVISSKAEAIRLLDTIAEKRKHPRRGIYWDVKKEVRDRLGLDNLPDGPPSPCVDTIDKATTKKSAERVGGLELLGARTGSDSKNCETPSPENKPVATSSGTKRKRTNDLSTSAKMLAAFLNKKF